MKPAGFPPEKGPERAHQPRKPLETVADPFRMSRAVESSPAISSSVRPLVSGRRKETMVPQSMKRAKICMRCWMGLVFFFGDEVEKRGNERLDELEFTFVLYNRKKKKKI